MKDVLYNVAPQAVPAGIFQRNSCIVRKYTQAMLLLMLTGVSVKLEYAIVKGNLTIKGGTDVESIQHVTVEGDTIFED